MEIIVTGMMEDKVIRAMDSVDKAVVITEIMIVMIVMTLVVGAKQEEEVFL